MGGAGSTPIHRAAKEGNLTELRVMVQQHGSKINDQEKDMGYAALHVAAWQGYDAIARELLARGANPNLVDKEGRTALHLAAQRGHAEVVRALLRANAARDVRDNLNHTAWDYSINKYPHVAQMIGPPAPIPDRRSGGPPAPPKQQPPSQPPSQPPPQPPAPERQRAQPIYPSVPDPHAPPPPQGTQSYQPSTAATYQPQQYPNPYAPPAQYPPHPATSKPSYPDLYGQSAPQPQQPSAPPPAAYQQPSAPQQPPTTQPPNPIPPQPPSYPGMPPAAGQATPSQQQLMQQAVGVPLPSAVSQGGTSVDDWAPVGPTDWDGQPETDRVDSRPSGGRPSRPGSETNTNSGARPHQNPLKSAADLALQQLAKLGIGQPHPPGQHKPPLAHIVEGLAAAAAAALGHQLHPHQQQGGVHAGSGVGEGPARVSASGDRTSASGDRMSNGASGTWGSVTGTACRTYKYEDLAAATQNFAASNKIGQGGFGAVYRGMLDGVPVAVKVMDVGPEAMQGTKEFMAEVNILGRLHHPHVVLLIGACPEQGLLVYELAEGGSLEDCLFDDRPGVPSLPWQDRIRVAAEVASALLYLHSAPEPIVHMDIKPANILLDRTFRTKLGDVGLARLMGGPLPPNAPIQHHAPSTQADSQLVGTLAYVDPEYLRTGQFSTKSDVYALGVVMLQLLTGQDKRNVITTVEEARQNVLYFAYVLDKRAGNWPAAEAMAFADVALKCAQCNRHDRPDLRTEILPTLLQLKDRTQLYAPPPAIAHTPASAPTPSAGSTTHTTSAGPPSSAVDSTPGVVPAMFVCPITQDIMQDPVVAADGYTYEREAIAAWLTRANTSPLTNLPLPHNQLVPNHLVRSAIKDWQQQQQQGAGRAH